LTVFRKKGQWGGGIFIKGEKKALFWSTQEAKKREKLKKGSPPKPGEGKGHVFVRVRVHGIGPARGKEGRPTFFTAKGSVLRSTGPRRGTSNVLCT